METPSWEQVRHEFIFDGSWRDIYVIDSDLALWERLIASLKTSDYDLQYSLDGHAMELPNLAEEAFQFEASRLLSVRFRSVQANCHFFWPDEIEFDIDPREITGQPQLDALFGFMGFVAATVGRDVILTPESLSKSVIFRVRASDGVVEHHDMVE